MTSPRSSLVSVRPRFVSSSSGTWDLLSRSTNFEDMTTLSGALRERFAASFSLDRPEVVRHQKSTDGTMKWLLGVDRRHLVESVYIPQDDRGALCMSSQVGCTLTCRFCHTGTQRLVRNLEPGEIVGQFMLARDTLGEWPAPVDGRRLLSNIVMMGMGEPLYNFDNVKTALSIIMDPEGIALSRRRITLSTAGVVPMMKRCGEELGVDLAVSLHAVNDEVRTRLVPLNRKYPIGELLDACRAYPGAGNARRITFEYVMPQRTSTIPMPMPRNWFACSRESRPKVNLTRSMPGPERPSNVPRTGALPPLPA